MGILYVQPKWVKRRRKKTGSSGCLRVERNRDGILYFRQPKGHDEIMTWRIHPAGEAMLRKAGVGDGMCLASGMFKKLHDGGHLYTASAPGSQRRSGAAAGQQAAMTYVTVRTKGEEGQQPGEGSGSGKIITVWNADRVKGSSSIPKGGSMVQLASLPTFPKRQRKKSKMGDPKSPKPN